MTDGLLRPHNTGISVFQRLLDVGVICAALWVSLSFYEIAISNQYLVSAALAVTCFSFIAEDNICLAVVKVVNYHLW